MAANDEDRTGGSSDSRVRVWDLPLRLFHWALVGLIAFSYATAELGIASMQWHMYSGYAILTLLIFRIIWGLVGSRHARFASFLTGPGRILRYAGGLLRGREAHYPGHNPLGALSVVAFLLAIGLQVGTGLFSADDILTEGPLASLVSSDLSEELTDLHEATFNFILALIALHLLAVAFHSFVKREGLIRAMITGRKRTVGAQETGSATAEPGLLTTFWGLLVLALAAAAVYGIVEVLPAALG